MSKKLRGQDEFTRARRMSKGCCPTHGHALGQDGLVWKDGEAIGITVECPRSDCEFKKVEVVEGRKGISGILYKALLVPAAVLALITGCADADFEMSSATNGSEVETVYDVGTDSRTSVPRIDGSEDAGSTPDTLSPPPDTLSPSSEDSMPSDAGADDTGSLTADAPKTLSCGSLATDYVSAKTACEQLAKTWCYRNLNCGNAWGVDLCQTAKKKDFGCGESTTTVVCAADYEACNSDIAKASCYSGLGSGGAYDLGRADTTTCRKTLDQNAGMYVRP